MKNAPALLFPLVLLALPLACGGDEPATDQGGVGGVQAADGAADGTGDEVADAPTGPAGIAPLEGVGFPNPSTYGDLVFGGQPTEADLATLKERGVTRIVDLRTEAEDRGYDEAATCETLGLEYVALPVSPAAIDDTTVDGILATFEEGGPMLVHCASGNRAQLMFGLHRVLNEGAELEATVANGLAHGMSESSAVVLRELAVARQ